MIRILGLLSLALYGSAVRLEGSNATGDVLAFLGLFFALFALCIAAHRFARAEQSIVTILVFAALFRLVMVGVGLPRDNPLDALARDIGGVETGYERFLLYDNDVWRYLWDGHVRAVGLDPFAKTPAEFRDEAEELDEPQPPLTEEIWWDVLDNVSFARHTTVYPPFSQALFQLSHAIAPGSVFVYKLLLSLVDFGTCLVLAAILALVGRPRRDVLLYAWNPLVIKEFSGSGHVDALMVFGLVLSVWALLAARQRMAHALLAAAALAKVSAGVLFPLFLTRTHWKTWWVFPSVLFVFLIPYVGSLSSGAQGLAAYQKDWIFNPGPWLLIEQTLALVGVGDATLWAHVVSKGLTMGLLLWLFWWAVRRNGNWMTAAFFSMAVLILLHSAVMPWYLPWALPLAILIGDRSWVALMAMSLLSYLFYVERVEHAWWLWLEYGVFFSVLAAQWYSGRRLGSTD